MGIYRWLKEREREEGRGHAIEATKNHDCRHNEVNKMMICCEILSLFSFFFFFLCV